MVRWLSAALLALALLSAGRVEAQSAEARAHFDAGREHARAERWTEALEEFRASDALLSRAVTQFNVASALMRLGRAREALAECDRIAERDDVDEGLLRDVAALRAAAQASLRTLVLTVSPAEAVIEIDGEAQPGEGASRELLLDPGSHALVARAPGHGEARLTLAPDQSEAALTLSVLPATLVVEATEPDAEIWIDGVPRGLGHLEEAVALGSHRVHVERDGRVPYDTEITIGPGERVVVPAELPLPPPPAAVPLVEDPIFWSVLGGGAAIAIGVAIGVGVAVGTAPQPYGGTSGVVIAPLLSF